MSNKENIAIKDLGKTCCKCLKETEVKKIFIPALGYDSSFDNFSTQIDLCENCFKETNSEWWKLEIENGSYGGHYKYEEDIFNFVKGLPLSGQELFFGRYANGACSGYMTGQDWIDYELGILSHEKCKEYGYYSPQEIFAYENRFPTCKEVFLKIYEDGSKGTYCKKGAHGNEDGSCCSNISSECYDCTLYGIRESDIEELDVKKEFYENERKILEEMIRFAQSRLKLLEQGKLKNESF